jgi:hypothetical protein
MAFIASISLLFFANASALKRGLRARKSSVAKRFFHQNFLDVLFLSRMARHFHSPFGVWSAIVLKSVSDQFNRVMGPQVREDRSGRLGRRLWREAIMAYLSGSGGVLLHCSIS